MSSNHRERVAIITGGTTGLGGATVKLFAEKGYRVLATNIDDRNQFIDALLANGLNVSFFAADLRKPEAAAKAIIARAVELWGRVDVVVNCAARIEHKSVLDVTEEDWDAIFAVNLKAPFFMAQAAFPQLERVQGCIINVSSTNAWRVNLKNQLYDSLKAALNHMSKGLALEFRDAGVRVNAIMPGGMHTPLITQWLEKHLGHAPTPEESTSALMAQPEWLAQGILALASDELRWINGAELPMDGGAFLG
ncbi:MAG: SDR family oxidoreductase [Actinobacteria bacterium]|nr:SDR family oxidoreductase [Actinomycetota bacterium]